MLTLPDLERLGKETGAKLQTVRQPDASRGHGANYWYEVRIGGADKMEILRRTLARHMHPIEKVKRIGLGELSVEGIPRGRYRLLDSAEVAVLKNETPAFKKIAPKRKKNS